MSKEIAISQKQIESRILSIRGNQVMIDRDLAEMYQVEVKILNKPAQVQAHCNPPTCGCKELSNLY